MNKKTLLASILLVGSTSTKAQHATIMKLPMHCLDDLKDTTQRIEIAPELAGKIKTLHMTGGVQYYLGKKDVTFGTVIQLPHDTAHNHKNVDWIEFSNVNPKKPLRLRNMTGIGITDRNWAVADSALVQGFKSIELNKTTQGESDLVIKLEQNVISTTHLDKIKTDRMMGFLFDNAVAVKEGKEQFNDVYENIKLKYTKK